MVHMDWTLIVMSLKTTPLVKKKFMLFLNSVTSVHMENLLSSHYFEYP